MPEGHTIHRLARQQTPVLVGRHPGMSSPQGRFADGAALLDGRLLERVDPYGKHLFYRFEGGAHLHVHLGLYGTVVMGPLGSMPDPRGALRLRMTTSQTYVDLRGPTACEVLTATERVVILDRLGPDPLRPGSRGDRAYERIRRSRTSIGALLMDQSVLAGVGNVYRAELLYRHGIDPHRPGTGIGEPEWQGMWDDLRRLMQAGVRAGRIVTTRPEHRGRRTGPAGRDDAFYVYRRTGLPCRICGAEVRTQELVGRNLYWCPRCQAV